MANLVFLIGYRGVGKTTLGKRLANSLGYRFYDTDKELCRQEDNDIASIVKLEGWEGFRKKEKNLLLSISESENMVVSTGGGAVLHQDEWRVLAKQSTIFWLTADQAVIIERLKNDPVGNAQRPLLMGSDLVDEVLKLLKEREPLYLKTAHYQIDTARQNIEEAVREMRNILLERAV